MGKAIRASVLVLLLACSVQAGWIQNETPAQPPPPPQSSPVQEPTNFVQAPTANAQRTDGEAYSLTQIALELLAVLPSLL